jgi:hypothetical protein
MNTDNLKNDNLKSETNNNNNISNKKNNDNGWTNLKIFKLKKIRYKFSKKTFSISNFI